MPAATPVHRCSSQARQTSGTPPVRELSSSLNLDDRPALRVTPAPACQQLYLTVSLSAADVWPCGPGGAFLAAASRVPGEQPSAGGLGRADGSNAARQCRGSWTVRSIKNAWTACGTSPRGRAAPAGLPYDEPSQDHTLHGYIPNFWDMIALQLRQRLLIAPAAAGFEAVPARVSAASGQRLEKSV
jgi:hypothetical protein